MDRQQLLQTRRLVGWWLDVPTSHLTGVDSVTLRCHVSNIHNVISDDTLERIFKGSKIDVKKRRHYLRAALSGVALSEIAQKENVQIGAVSSLVKDTLTRLALGHAAVPKS